MADDYDDDDFRRSNYERMFGTTPEAEAEAREMEERAAKIKSDEVMQWARQRAEARESNVVRHDNGSVGDIVRRDVPGAGRPLPVVTKAYSAPAASAAAATDWAPYIKRAIRKESNAASEAMAKAIAQSIGKDLIALERSNTELHERVQHLENEVDDLFKRMREQARDAQIAERFKQYDELQDRLARLEGGGRPLKVVG